MGQGPTWCACRWRSKVAWVFRGSWHEPLPGDSPTPSALWRRPETALSCLCRQALPRPLSTDVPTGYVGRRRRWRADVERRIRPRLGDTPTGCVGRRRSETVWAVRGGNHGMGRVLRDEPSGCTEKRLSEAAWAYRCREMHSRGPSREIQLDGYRRYGYADLGRRGSVTSQEMYHMDSKVSIGRRRRGRAVMGRPLSPPRLRRRSDQVWPCRCSKTLHELPPKDLTTGCVIRRRLAVGWLTEVQRRIMDTHRRCPKRLRL